MSDFDSEITTKAIIYDLFGTLVFLGRDSRLYHALARTCRTPSLLRDALASLRKAKKLGLRIGLVSNLATPYVHCFRRLNLAGYFDATVFSCDVGCAKPDAEIYKLALGELSVQAHGAIMIGDGLTSMDLLLVAYEPSCWIVRTRGVKP